MSSKVMTISRDKTIEVSTCCVQDATTATHSSVVCMRLAPPSHSECCVAGDPLDRL